MVDADAAWLSPRERHLASARHRRQASGIVAGPTLDSFVDRATHSSVLRRLPTTQYTRLSQLFAHQVSRQSTHEHPAIPERVQRVLSAPPAAALVGRSHAPNAFHVSNGCDSKQTDFLKTFRPRYAQVNLEHTKKKKNENALLRTTTTAATGVSARCLGYLTAAATRGKCFCWNQKRRFGIIMTVIF